MNYKKHRVSGIMRVKNDGPFIRRCIESCIDALDELIVVHNDCTDNSVEEIEKMVAKYPDKIRRYEYPHKILGFGLTRKEFEFVKNLPEGSPELLSTYYNFALSKVTSEYALKIDADQEYFTDTLKEWCDFMRGCKPMSMSLKIFAGKVFQYYLSLFRKLSVKSGRVLPMMPMWLAKTAYPAYINYAKYLFSHERGSLALSGVNILETDKILVSMAHDSKLSYIHGPFNGIGDTVLFKMNDSLRFEKAVYDDYNSSDTKDGEFSVAEVFNLSLRIMYIGFFWTHLRAMRPGAYEQSLKAYEHDPEAFLPWDEFKTLKYKEVRKQATKKIFMPHHQILFEFVYKANSKQLAKEMAKVAKR